MFGKKKRAKKAHRKGDTGANVADLVVPAVVPKSALGKVGSLVASALDPKTAKRMITVGKIAAPALAPLAYKTAAGAREYLDNQRARRLGVTAVEVAAYRGVTGSTQARADGLLKAIESLRARRGGELEIVRFADVSKNRIADLSAAVTAAGTMPGAHRRAALKAIGREFDQIDRDLMTYLVGFRS